MNCRVGLDWIGCVVQVVGALFFTIGFGTRYWATSDSSVNAGLFTTCDGSYCYDTHVFYHGKSGNNSWRYRMHFLIILILFLEKGNLIS
uniref:Uncharacterized protein n=1 Tax=Magallana gigas TaxID=29159 RepID=A0A8W8NDF1_MAGGI